MGLLPRFPPSTVLSTATRVAENGSPFNAVVQFRLGVLEQTPMKVWDCFI